MDLGLLLSISSLLVGNAEELRLHGHHVVFNFLHFLYFLVPVQDLFLVFDLLFLKLTVKCVLGVHLKELRDSGEQFGVPFEEGNFEVKMFS